MFSRYALVFCLVAYAVGLCALNRLGLVPRAGLYDLSRLQGVSVIELEGDVLESPLLRWGQTRFILQARARPLEAFTGRIVVTLPSLDATLSPGDHVRARGWLTKPGERSRDYWASRGVYAFLKVWSSDGFMFVQPSARWNLRHLAWIFQKRYCAFWRERLSPAASALLLGVTIGSKGILPPDLKDTCIRAGVYHIVVVSGQNMSLLVNVGLVVLLALACPKRYALWISLPLIMFYATAVGGDPPVVRAAVSAIVGLLVMAMGRDIPRYYPLCIAAGWILLQEPQALFGASFQLSFGATLSILLFWPMWESRKTGLPRWCGRVLEPILMGFMVYIGIWPMLVAYFHRLSMSGLLANWSVFPLSGILMVLGLLLGSWGVFSPQHVPQVLIHLTGWMVECLLALIKEMAAWSWAVWPIEPLPGWVLSLYYGGLFGILFVVHRRKMMRLKSPHEKSSPRL